MTNGADHKNGKAKKKGPVKKAKKADPAAGSKAATLTKAVGRRPGR